MTQKEARKILQDAQEDINAIRRGAKRIPLTQENSPLRGPIESLLERAAVQIEHVIIVLRIGGLEN